MDFLTRDLQLAIRSLLRRPGFAAVAILTFSLGIGASVSVFSVLDGVLLEPLPHPQADRLVRLWTTTAERERPPWAAADFVDLVDQSTAYDAVAGYQYMDCSLQEDGLPARVPGVTVSADFFTVLGNEPALGRVFNSTTDPPGGDRVVVLSHGLWQSQMGGDPSVLGSAVELNNQSYTVIGVMDPGFEFPRGARLWMASQYRVPERTGGGLGDNPSANRDSRYFHAMARLAPTVSIEAARQEGEAITARLAEAFPDTNRGQGFDIVPLHETVTGGVRPTLIVLFGAVGLLLLIAVTNVANLLLTRATGRLHEVAIRAALGAGRRRIARQLLTESLVLALAGGVGGVLIALFGTGALVSLAAGELPRAAEVRTDLDALGFTLVVSLISGLLFGLVPVLWLARANPASTLGQAGGRTIAGSGHGRLRGALVVTEIALSLLLLVGAGLMARTLAALSTVDPGFSARRAVTAKVWLPGSESLGPDEIRAFQDEVLRRVRALPGVTGAGAVLSLPVDWGVRAVTSFLIEGQEVERGAEPTAGLQAASPGYFQTIGIPVLAGRTFTEADGPDSPPVVIISEAFARRHYAGQDPVGRRISSGDPGDEDFQWATIVGVVGSTRHDGLDAEARAEVYQPMAQSPWPYMSLVLSTDGDPAALTEPLRRAVMEIRADQPVERIVTLEQILHESLARRRFSMTLLVVFAALALLLASVGLYGVMSFSVAQRSQEIGIRMAVGAATSEIARLVARDGGRLLGWGLALGTLASLLAAGVLERFLFQVPARDPLSLAAAAVTLFLAAAVATWIPAHRATRTDPIASLRAQQ